MTRVNHLNSLVKDTMIEGISIILNQTNNKRYAQIDLEKYGDQWEDFYDLLLVEQVRDEGSMPLEELEKQLKDEGLLNEL